MPINCQMLHKKDRLALDRTDGNEFRLGSCGKRDNDRFFNFFNPHRYNGALSAGRYD